MRLSYLDWRGSNQRVPEYCAWTALCVGLGAKTYLELGRGSAWCQRDAGMKCLTVDVLPEALGGIDHIQASSHDPELVPRVLDYFGGDPDIIFIDADHSYEAVSMDFELWWPHARVAVGFHDIRMPDVGGFWNKISRQYPSIEMVSKDVASADAWQHTSDHTGDIGVGGFGVLLKI